MNNSESFLKKSVISNRGGARHAQMPMAVRSIVATNTRCSTDGPPAEVFAATKEY